MPILNWLTRDEDIRAAQKAPYRLLEEAPGLSGGERDTGSMLIQGDNLEALKALLPFYAGRIKCIYIDPPFNTGQALDHYDDNLEHTIWLSIMIDLSVENPETVYLQKRVGYSEIYVRNGKRWLFYKDKLKEIDGQRLSGEPLTNLWDDLPFK